MATAWVRARSMSCRSSAVADDVYCPPPQAKGSAAVPAKASRRSRSMEPDRPSKKKEPASSVDRKKPKQQAQLTASSAVELVRPSSAAFLAMTELPEGHPSRRIVELIFASGWGPNPPEMEALFRVHTTPRALSRFEDARAAAQSRGAAAGDARCAADGNETMRFQCRAADGDGQVICAAVATTSRLSAVRTFGGSGAADADATARGRGVPGPGRRGVLVCRVIAGRVRRADGPPSRAGEHQSVDAGGGELLVLDRRAVLPCFLVVYRVRPALDSSTSRRSR